MLGRCHKEQNNTGIVGPLDFVWVPRCPTLHEDFGAWLQEGAPSLRNMGEKQSKGLSDQAEPQLIPAWLWSQNSIHVRVSLLIVGAQIGAELPCRHLPGWKGPARGVAVIRL